MESQIKDMKHDATSIIGTIEQELRDLESTIEGVQEADNLDIIAYLLDTTEEKAQQICELSEASEFSIDSAIRKILPDYQF